MPKKASPVAIAVMDELRQQLRARRKELGLLQKQVAHASGLSDKMISRFERGKTRLSLTGLLAYASAVRLTLLFRMEEK